MRVSIDIRMGSSLPVTPSNVRTVRKVGTPIMLKYGYDVTLTAAGSNFQAIDTYNKSTGFGGISNFLRIPHLDLMKLRALQVEDDFEEKRGDGIGQKMKWLMSDRGGVYFQANNWEFVSYVRWGTIITGRFVYVEGWEDIRAHIPNIGITTARYARLGGFRRTHWDLLLDDKMNKRPDFTQRLADLVAAGLIHQVWCTYKNNVVSDRTPKGVIFSPFWSPMDWTLRGPATPQVTHLYLPEEQLE